MKTSRPGTSRILTGTKRPPTAGPVPSHYKNVKPGYLTQQIYTLIQSNNFIAAIKLLDSMPESRSSLSLIGYCSFQLMEYGRCVDVYSQLLDLCPNEQRYRLEYSRSLLKNGNHDAALRALEFVDEPGLRDEMLALNVSILFEMDELESCEQIINKSLANGQWISIKASVLARQGQFVQAIDLYHQAQKELGYRAEIVYGLALSMYNLDMLQEALEKVDEILEYCRMHFPSLFPNPYEVVQKSVGNSRLLEHSYLVEATNLKALIQHSLRDSEGAKKTIMQLPPRFDNELDQISLHNLAVIGAECGEDMEANIIKLEQILEAGKSPDGTVMNLAILYCKSGKYNKAQELISLYEQVLQETTNTYDFEYICAIVLQATDPQETILKLSSLNDQIYNDIEQLTNELKNRKSDAMALAKEGDEILVHLMRVTGTLCALFMVSREYNKAEMLLKRSATFLNENNEYKSLVADLYYWQEKYELAASHYANMESPSDKDTSNLVLSLIRSNQTQKAESILQFLQQSNPTLLSIVNLHIAALYCSNNNYEFGISRMLSVMTPLLNTLNKKTWLHVKRCLVRLHREQSLGTVMISDDLVSNIVKMLKECVLIGANLDAVGDVRRAKTNKIGAEAATLLKEFEKMMEFI